MEVFISFLLITAHLLSVRGMAVAAPSSTTDETNETTTEQPVYYTRTVGPTTRATDSAVPEVLITLAFISGCAIVGVLISKFADFIYDKYVSRTSRNNGKSEAAKKLLRARVAIMRMKPDPKTADGKIAKKAAATWMSRTVGKKESAVAPDATNKVGEVHVPGIKISTEKSPDHPDPPQTSTTPIIPIDPESEDSSDSKESAPQYTTKDLHPIERIDLGKIKPGGRLPPVVVHDMPKLTEL